MTESLGPVIARVEQHRDRFSASALVVGVIAVILAVWTTAPTLDVAVPLVGGAHVGFNIGYVLAGGNVVLGLAMAWLVTTLLSMHRLQEAIIQEAESRGERLTPTQRRQLMGPWLSDG